MNIYTFRFSLLSLGLGFALSSSLQAAPNHQPTPTENQINTRQQQQQNELNSAIQSQQVQEAKLGRDGKPDGTYKMISSPKTVYDPAKFSDHEMLEMGQKATAKGYLDSIKTNRNGLKNYQDSQEINGIKFRYYIDKDTKGVTNVHPE